MAFTEVQELDCEVTTALGGRNRTSGKANPIKIEGYFLGSKVVQSAKSPGGEAKLHIFKTEKGNIGVWGKTDLDRKLAGVEGGTMVRVTHTGMTKTPRGEMYKYKVELDKANTLEGFVSASPSIASDEGSNDSALFDDSPETELGEESSYDEVSPSFSVKPARPASSPDAARQAKVQALLNGGRHKTQL